jgi:proteasome activator subunit 4
MRFEIGRLPKAAWRIRASSRHHSTYIIFDLSYSASLARIIVYSMAQDGHSTPPSNVPTPLFTPPLSGMNTPQVQSSTLKEFLSAPLGNKNPSKSRVYLAGSKSLDSLARLIASTESFFHPSNSGAWTSDVCAFVDLFLWFARLLERMSYLLIRLISSCSAERVHQIYRILYESTYLILHTCDGFICSLRPTAGWHEEIETDCKTPMVRLLSRELEIRIDNVLQNRRLTRQMKRELVKCLRTVALLAMFSQESGTITNVQSCLKSMCLMEPDLILPPILDRAIPSLEALVEVCRCHLLCSFLMLKPG